MYFEIYPSYLGIKKQWRWRLRAANHRIIADSAESYVNKTDCYTGVSFVRNTNIFTPIRETLI